mmetsp:Transcript_14010/g.35357  ORF Transcript_14010/g.35357 Transcript_14010/m.35357 type:complete len:422 (-) Transcript_14010:1631-2896(-)
MAVQKGEEFALPSNAFTAQGQSDLGTKSKAHDAKQKLNALCQSQEGGPQSPNRTPTRKRCKALKRTLSAPPKLTPTRPGLTQKRRFRSGPKSKSSNFIGVSQYKRTGRWEAHIWDCGASPGVKGKQLHLGSFDCAEDAARAYDRAAIHFRGEKADTNYPAEQYKHDPVLDALSKFSKEEFVLRLRGVAQHHKIQSQKNKEMVMQVSRPLMKLNRSSSCPGHSPHSVLQHGHPHHPSSVHPEVSFDMLVDEGMYGGKMLNLGHVNSPAQCHKHNPYVYRGRVLHRTSPNLHGPMRAAGSAGMMRGTYDYASVPGGLKPPHHHGVDAPPPSPRTPQAHFDPSFLVGSDLQAHGSHHHHHHQHDQHAFPPVPHHTEGGGELYSQEDHAENSPNELWRDFVACGDEILPPLMEGMGEVDTGSTEK